MANKVEGSMLVTLCSLVINIMEDDIYLPGQGVGGTDKKEHEVEMEFFKDIDVEVRPDFYFSVQIYDGKGTVSR